MKIHSFSPEDKDAVIQLWNECNLVVPWNDPQKDIQRKLKDSAELFLLGKLDGEVIASAMGGYEGHRGWINYLAIAPAQQGKGYARQIMEDLELRLQALGCPKLNLQIRSSNVDVIRFYEALGYKVDACVSLGKRLIPDS